MSWRRGYFISLSLLMAWSIIVFAAHMVSILNSLTIGHGGIYPLAMIYNFLFLGSFLLAAIHLLFLYKCARTMTRSVLTLSACALAISLVAPLFVYIVPHA